MSNHNVDRAPAMTTATADNTIFDDPVTYLADLGVEAELVTEPGLAAAA